MKKTTLLWTLFSILFVLFLGEVFYLYNPFGQQKDQPIAIVRKTPPTIKIEEKTPIKTESEEKTTEDTKSTSIVDPGVTWLEPTKLSNVELLATGDSKDINSAEYYKVAKFTDGGEIINAKVTYNSPSLPVIYRFKKDESGKYFYLAKHSAEKNYQVVSDYLTKDLTFNDKTIYQSLSAPSFINVKNTNLKISEVEGIFSELKQPVEIAQTAYGKVYRNFVDENTNGSAGVNYVIKLADSTYQTYVVNFSFLTDNEVALIIWKDGTKNEAKFTAEGYAKCGMVASDNIMVDNSNMDNRLSEVGKTNNGDKIYTVKSSDSVMQAAYENYKIGRTKDILSIEEFAAKKPLFIWKAGIGDYIVFTNRDFGGLAECGKPVVYLYPEKETKVTVKIAADISKSDPLYKNGWEAVAFPSGKLIVENQEYPYLFWEGQGQNYPIVKEGAVVEKNKVKSVIEDQLSLLGLNEKESGDFLEYWLPKMPETPYVRLTWFGTQEMNKLAPISVNPKPETMIRVFLDFEGLKKKIEITPQKLSHIERKGFTLVEWGGLLREQSN